MNIFEGSRRVAMLTGGLIAAGFLLAFFEQPPVRITVSYQIAELETAPVRIPECPPLNVIIEKGLTSTGGRLVWATLCLKSEVANAVEYAAWIVRNEMKKGTPEFETVAAAYKATKSQGFAPAASVSEMPDIQLYVEAEKRGILPTYEASVLTRALSRALNSAQARVKFREFKIPEADEGYITRLGWMQTLKQAGEHLLGLIASLAGFWVFTWAVGWIVRGFMGIPRGLDQKPQG